MFELKKDTHAHSPAQIEALGSWIDLVTYQMHTMGYKEQQKLLAGPIALLKYYSTRVAWVCADHSSQVCPALSICVWFLN